MNCRRFECRVADWASQRLPPGDARRMAAHAQECASCARSAREERGVREGWRQAGNAAPPASDAWPRLAARLGERPPWRNRPPVGLAWALSAAALAAIMALGPQPRMAHAPPAQAEVVAASLQPQAGPASWPMLPGVSRVEPVVDDPTGASMAEVWTQLDTNTTAPGSG